MPRPPLVVVLIAYLGCVAACAPPRADESGVRLSNRLERTIERATDAPVRALALPASEAFEQIPQDPRNPLTPAKVALGKALFHEIGLSIATIDPARRGTVSCASCHVASAGFQAGRLQGLGEGATGFGEFANDRELARGVDLRDVDAQGIRTPSILNVAYQPVLHWNGELGAGNRNAGTADHWTEGTPKAVNRLGYEGVESQAIAGLSIHRMAVDETLVDALGYRSAFDEAFGALPQNARYTTETAGLAIAAYERTLLPTEAPFQRWLRGETHAMLPAQLRGALVFFGKGKCASCHSGPALTDGNFHVLGLPDLYASPRPTVRASADMGVNLGRASFTRRTEDLYAFKTPQLYNLADSPYHGHGSGHETLEGIVRHHLAGESAKPRVESADLDGLLRARRLTNREVSDLVVFLRDGLRDPDLGRYVPASVSGREASPLALGR